MKKPTKLLNLVGFSTVCISTGGERGTTTFQTPKKYKFPFIYKKSIKSILYKGFENKRYWIILDKLG
jgi:hypothetical protein